MLKCRARDEWIGWSRVLQYQQLQFIANNSRFLVLLQTRRHTLPTLISIATAAALAGARSFEAIAQWAQELSQAQLKRLRGYFSPLRKRFEPPSGPTIRHMLTHIDAAAMDSALWPGSAMPLIAKVLL